MTNNTPTNDAPTRETPKAGPFADMYAEMARVFAGQHLHCNECGRDQALSVDEAATFMRLGWPKCHGREMVVVKDEPPALGTLAENTLAAIMSNDVKALTDIIDAQPEPTAAQPWIPGEVKTTRCPICNGLLRRIGPDSYSNDVWKCDDCAVPFSSGVGGAQPATDAPAAAKLSIPVRLLLDRLEQGHRILRWNDKGYRNAHFSGISLVRNSTVENAKSHVFVVEDKNGRLSITERGQDALEAYRATIPNCGTGDNHDRN